MTPEKLYLKGFAGIRDGMRLDEYTLDLTTLPGNAQLVAIAGPNGAGKSTVMDNLHPYRLMPSRAGSYSPAGFSFYDHLTLPENIKELTWSHAGTRYRSTLVFRMNGKRKSEAFLHVDDDGRWVPVKLADGALSDGKTETYDTCLEGVIGTAEVFFTSQFAAQNRRQLSSYTPAQVKALMVELLGLEEISRKGEKAARVVSQFKATLDDRRRSLRALADPAEAIGAAEGALAGCNARVLTLEAQKSAHGDVLALAQQQLATLTAARDAAAETERRRQALQASHAQGQAQSAAAIKQLREDQSREAARSRTAEEALAGARALAQRQLKQSAKARQDAQTLLARKDEILRAKSLLGALVETESQARAALEAAQSKQSERDVREKALAVARARLDALRQQAGEAALRAEGLKKRLGLTDTVPCRGTDLQGQCRLLSDAHEAHALMPSADSEVARLRTQFEQLQADIRGLEGAVTALGNTAAALASAGKRLERLAVQRRALETTASLQDALGQAEARLAECVRSDQESADALTSAEQRAQRDAAEAKRLIEAIEQRILERDTQAKAALHEMQTELARLPAAFDLPSLKAAEDALRAASERARTIDAASAQLVQERAGLFSAVESAKRNAVQAAALQAGIEALEAELGWWSLLARALGKDGVIALCIDDAGPELSRLANALLLACYGPRFTVRIDTQVATAKDELREGFDVVVFDADTGQSKSLEVMSGGQRVWINECLTRAIALYLVQSSGRRYDTLFSDEADGPLDPERKRMFMQMKREVLHLGGYQREYFVSQTPELVQLADAVIDLELCRTERVGFPAGIGVELQHR